MLDKVIKRINPTWIFWEDYVIEDNSDWKWPVLRILKEWLKVPTDEQINQTILEIEVEELKQSKISEYKAIEKEAIGKRSEYITAELLPEWSFKTLKLNKLSEERLDIENRFNLKIQELISLYWDTILQELI